MEKSQDRQEKKIVESFIEENYQGGIQQRHYMDGMIKDSIRNIRDNWKEIRDVGKKHRGEGYWKCITNGHLLICDWLI